MHYKKEVSSTKETIKTPQVPIKHASDYIHRGETSGEWHYMLIVAAYNGISDVFYNLETARRPSSKDIPNTTNGLAYTTNL